MKLSAPTQPVWIIAVVLGCLGILGHFVTIPTVSANAFYLVAAGFVLLAAATMLKGW